MTNHTKPMIPKFDIPDAFTSEDDYLRHLTCEGAKRHYQELTEEIRKRIDFELETIKTKEFAGYFLMIQEMIQAARKMDVLVGPGRSASAGSIVNYCLGITEIDSLKFDLLFERFLNPEQTTLPSFQFDFEEEGRDKVLHWLIEKYGKEKIAKMITFSGRRLGIHACAVTIGSDNLENIFSLIEIKPWENEINVIPYERSYIEEKGLVILDFLPLRALSVIKRTLSNIKNEKGIDLDISKIPFDDAKTFELFRDGDTDGVFQFESEAMQTYLHQLQPDTFEDLVALYALYRPGLMDKIPDLIHRKRNEVKIYYDFPEMETRLKETYGIYVYQEQLLLLSQDLADWCEISPNLFLKSHAVAYTLIGYRMAYLKANFREEFEKRK
jgi:DNA polymerase-3 subunit alpha